MFHYLMVFRLQVKGDHLTGPGVRKGASGDALITNQGFHPDRIFYRTGYTHLEGDFAALKLFWIKMVGYDVTHVITSAGADQMA